MFAPVLFALMVNRIGMKGERSMKWTAKKKMPVITGIAIGMAVSILVLLSMLAILCTMVLKESISEENLGIWLWGAVLVSAFAGCWLSSLLVRERKAVAAVGTAGGMFALLLIVHFLLFPGRFTGVVGIMVGHATGAVLAILIGTLGKGRGHKQIRKYRFG